LLANKPNAVEPWHAQITRDDIRLELFDHLQGFESIARRAYHLDIRIARKHLAHGFAHERRIIHDQGPDQLLH